MIKKTVIVFFVIIIIVIVSVLTIKKDKSSAKDQSLKMVNICKSFSTSNLTDLTYLNGNFKQKEDGFELSPKNTSSYLSNVFPLAYYPACDLEEGVVKVDFKIIGGEEDRYAGLVFGLTSAGDYYVVRASASENSVTIAKFRNGSRMVLQTYDAKVTDNQWHTLSVVIKKDKISVQLDDRPITDNYQLDTVVGRIGVNTKSDSITQFKNLNISNTP